ANHDAANNSAAFDIKKATAAVTVTCPATAQAYTGSAMTPCSASYKTQDGLTGALTPSYTSSTNVGTAGASATSAADANSDAANNSATFAIKKATAAVTVTCPATAQAYTGSAQTPCSASYTTQDGLTGALTPSYTSNTNVGTAGASASYAGDANHDAANN